VDTQRSTDLQNILSMQPGTIQIAVILAQANQMVDIL
jgi:hypothetical protein